MMYYNSSAIGFGLLALFCSVIGLLFGGWSRARKMSEAEKWQLKQAAELVNKEKEKTASAPTAGQTVRVASKTAAKNQQKAYARKAKERAEKEAKRQNKNQPQKKKKKGGH